LIVEETKATEEDQTPKKDEDDGEDNNTPIFLQGDGLESSECFFEELYK
jgi:hypothetical protein